MELIYNLTQKPFVTFATLCSAFPEQLKPMESLEKSRLLLLSNSASSLSITLSKNERLVNLDAAFSLLQLPSKTPTVAAVVVPLLAVIAFPLSLSLIASALG